MPMKNYIKNIIGKLLDFKLMPVEWQYEFVFRQ